MKLRSGCLFKKFHDKKENSVEGKLSGVSEMKNYI